MSWPVKIRRDVLLKMCAVKWAGSLLFPRRLHRVKQPIP